MHVLMNPCVPHDVRSLYPLAWAVGVRCLLMALAHADSRTLSPVAQLFAAFLSKPFPIKIQYVGLVALHLWLDTKVAVAIPVV